MAFAFRAWAARLVVSAVLTVPIAQADPLPATINTSLLSGTPAILAFDLVDGGSPGNTVAILNFDSDGTLGTIATIGDVSGSLPGQVTLGDASFFNEYSQAIVLGNIISFVFDASSNVPDPGSFPDAFALFLLDPSTGLSLVTTSDPTGANALFLFSIGDPNPLTVYQSPQVTVSVAAVPEPDGLMLVLTALAIAGLRFGQLRRKRVASAQF